MSKVDGNKQVVLNKVTKVLKKRKRTDKERLLTLEKKIKKLNESIEKKSYNNSYAISNVDGTTGSIASLCANIVPGDEDGKRTGLKIAPKYIQYKVWCYNEATTQRGAGCFTIVKDMHPDGTLPVITDIYSNGNPLALVAYQKKQRFKELKCHTFEYATSEWSGPISGNNYGHLYEGYIPIKEITKYSASNGGITDLLDGQNDYLLVWRSSNTSSGSLSYGTGAYVRIVYEDA